ncbi:hypothetical protein SAMN04489760_10829 [Syntrophus gentianae]|uniref:Polyhydroxyalkanoic acid system protein (PHA_gran_rgn) n=1 Tax=Syntrophus gentianae TaxID=43775 RepID=A0A1H7WV65_9BACT|nr:hypothetical protein [Syntrophus gentianae]SEM25403.1 hypothetical protein SAMN04489760_10829 [Syntrophus gentianae]
MESIFTISVFGNLSDVFKDIESRIRSNGGTFSGNLDSGKFSGKTEGVVIEGKYQVLGNRIIVRITRKPFLLPASAIEAEIRQYFRETADSLQIASNGVKV